MTGSVLVVDDEAPIRDLLKLVLEGEGYQVRQASDGAEALRAVAEAPPDVIILDLRMPGLSGVEFALQYKEMQKPPAPIIVITAAREAEDSIGELDVCAYLAKPFDLEALLEAVGACTSPAEPPGA